ncbi:MAG: hypothetical protein HY906_25385 [Deltaproteobacteria bacterium]|nr:hypothetical protein [Deltaproteobacteria bacterium]
MRRLVVLLLTLGGIGCGNEPPARTWTPAECLADRACPLPLVSAHRGNCGAGEPENTLAAYLACEARGVRPSCEPAPGMQDCPPGHDRHH